MNDSILPYFIPLLTAHLVGDFLVQTDRSIQMKNNFWALSKHGLLIAFLSYLVLGIIPAWEITLGILISHVLLDAWKTHTKRGSALSRFLIDQGAHILIIYLFSAAANVRYGGVGGVWERLFGWKYLVVLTFAAGAIISVYVLSFIVELVLDSLNLKEKSGEEVDLQGGGRMIGYLERSLIFLFILIEYPAGIGFLVAAKSIFRFGELTAPDKRRQAEYIIIGTLLSILLGTVSAVLTAQVLEIVIP